MKAALWLLLLLAACPQPSCPVGGETCACTVDQTCDTGLACDPTNTCVDAGTLAAP